MRTRRVAPGMRWSKSWLLRALPEVRRTGATKYILSRFVILIYYRMNFFYRCPEEEYRANCGRGTNPGACVPCEKCPPGQFIPDCSYVTKVYLCVCVCAYVCVSTCDCICIVDIVLSYALSYCIHSCTFATAHSCHVVAKKQTLHKKRLHSSPTPTLKLLFESLVCIPTS